MKRLLAFASILVVAFCAGCGDSHEDLAADSLSKMREMEAVLAGVTDAASAKSANPKLKSLKEELDGINERQAKLGMPDEAEFKAMDAKYGKEMEELQLKLVGHMLRIGFDPTIRAELDDMDFNKTGG